MVFLKGKKAKANREEANGGDFNEIIQALKEQTDILADIKESLASMEPDLEKERRREIISQIKKLKQELGEHN